MNCIVCGERRISDGPREHDCCNVCAAATERDAALALVTKLRAMLEQVEPCPCGHSYCAIDAGSNCSYGARCKRRLAACLAAEEPRT